MKRLSARARLLMALSTTLFVIGAGCQPPAKTTAPDAASSPVAQADATPSPTAKADPTAKTDPAKADPTAKTDPAKADPTAKADPAKADPAKADPATANPGQDPASGALVRSLEAARYLPSGALFFIATDGYLPHFTRFNVAEAIKLAGSTAAGVVEESTQHLGFNVFDPAAVAAQGFALDAPVGFATWPSARQVVVFLPATNPTQVAQSLRELIKRNGESMADVAVASGQAQISCVVTGGPTTDLCVMTRDQSVFLVLGKTYKGPGAEPMAKRIASVTLDESLAASRPFQDALKQPDSAHLVGFVSFQEVVQELNERLTRNDDPATLKALEAKIAATSADDPALMALQDELNSAQYQARRWQARRQVVDLLLGVTPHLTFGAEDRGDHVAMNVRFHQSSPESFLLKGLRAGAQVPTLQRSLSGKPQLMFTAQGDPRAALALLDMVLGVDGEDTAMMRLMIKNNLGLDLERDLIEAASGEVGVALTLPRMDKDFDPMLIQGAVLIGFKSPEALQKTLDTLLANPMIKGFVQPSGAPGRYKVSLGPKSIYIGLVGAQLVISDDEATVDHVAAPPAATPWAATLTHPKLAAELEMSGDAARLLINNELLLWPVLSYNTMQMGSVSAMQGGGAPTDEQRKLEAEKQTLEDQINALYDEESDQLNARMLKMSAAFGVTFARVVTTPAYVEVVGGMYLDAGLPGVAAEIGRASLEFTQIEEASRAKRAPLQQQLEEIQRKLYSAPAAVTP
jgi:hypothetical protein